MATKCENYNVKIENFSVIIAILQNFQFFLPYNNFFRCVLTSLKERKEYVFTFNEKQKVKKKQFFRKKVHVNLVKKKRLFLNL